MIRTHIMLHHSLTSDGATVSAAAIDKYHRETMGWDGTGYHALVEDVTDNPELFDYRYQAILGRDWSAQAAACPQGEMNRRALHACCVGNFDLASPPDAMLTVLVKRIIRPWMHLFGISADHIIGHRDRNPEKSCPGRLFDIDEVRRMVA